MKFDFLVRRYFILLSSFLILLIFFLIGGILWWKDASSAPSSDPTEKRFVIKKGSTAIEVADELYKKNLIKSSFAFKFYVQLKGNSKKIQAGEYDIVSNLTLQQVVAVLLRSPKEVWVTIPEGLRKEEIVEKFVNSFELIEQKGGDFESEFFALTQDWEGFLFPDTYLFPKTASASAVIDKMLATFDLRTKDFLKDIDNLDLDLSEVVIVASLVEKETKTDEERPIVAGILLKRLNAGWSLNVDATVQYAIASLECKVQSAKCEWWPKITRNDYQFNSAYNTYKFAGLPPTPIANPGLSSIKAVVNSKNSPYWFYLHDSEGQIHFAKTLEEHNANIAKYIR